MSYLLLSCFCLIRCLVYEYPRIFVFWYVPIAIHDDFNGLFQWAGYTYIYIFDIYLHIVFCNTNCIQLLYFVMSILEVVN